MATIDLGKLGFVNKGTYSSSTSYEKNDLVQYTDSGILSTYLYINASAATGQTPSTSGTVNGTYWAFFAKGVADAVASAGNNKVLVTDGSGSLSPLAIGSAGLALKVNSSANGFEFGTAGGVLQVKSCQTGSYFSTTNTSLGTSAYDVTDLGLTLTPTSATSHILITGMIHAHHVTSYCGRGYITYNHSGISETVIKSSNASGSSYGCTFRFETGATNTSNVQSATPINLHITPNTTNAITFKTRIMTSNSGYPSVINNTQSQATDSDDGGHTLSSLTFWEIANGISPAVTNSNVGS
jgi:hypothetical protein